MAGWAALLLVVLPLAHAAGPVGLALDTTCTNAECYKQRNMTLLKQALLANYDMTVQPPRFGTERGALVSVQLALQQFQKLDTTNQEIQFFSWWRHSWTDPRLAWNPDHWGGITELTFFGTAAAWNYFVSARRRETTDPRRPRRAQADLDPGHDHLRGHR